MAHKNESFDESANSSKEFDQLVLGGEDIPSGKSLFKTTDGMDEKFNAFSLVVGGNIHTELEGFKESIGSDKDRSEDWLEFFDYEKANNLSELFNLAKKLFHKAELDNAIIFDPDINGLGIAFEHGGGFIVVGLSEDKEAMPSALRAEPGETIHFNKKEAEVSGSLEKESELLGGFSGPIIGHKLDSSQSSHLILSDAIDVVFYSGGHKHVENFELGKDLLWFFLSADQIVGVNSQVLNSSDMMLSFGESGTLTLLDVISSADHVDFV
jgi:hypothetical protein